MIRVFALLILSTSVQAAVDGTTKERTAFAKLYPKCYTALGTSKVSCPPYQIVYDRPKCLEGKLIWMSITVTKASARSTYFTDGCIKWLSCIPYVEVMRCTTRYPCKVIKVPYDCFKQSFPTGLMP